MILSAIAAISTDHAIGIGNELPWHLPEDLKFFKRMTMGSPVLMGRRTYDSLGKPLPGRANIVLSRSSPALPEGVKIVSALEEGIEALRAEGKPQGFVIGGGEIFRMAMPLLDRLYLTRVDTRIPGADAFFPDVEARDWELVWEEPHGADERHAFAYTFQQYARKRP